MKEGWDYKSLGDVCEILDSRRKPITKSKRESGTIPYYGATGILDYVKDYIFDEKLVLLGEDGAKWGAGENSAYIVEGKTWVNNHAHALRPKREHLIDELLVYYLNFANLQPFITGVTVPKLNQEKMRSIEIPVPPLSEQQSIVDYLDSAFAKIDAMKANAEKALNEAKALFQASLKEMLEPKEGWEEKKMSSIYDVRDGTHDSPKYQESGYPLVTSKNLRAGVLDMTKVNHISESDYVSINNRSKVDVGDVLFAMIGTIGNPVYVEEEPYYAIKNMALFKVPEAQSGKFLSYYLQKDDVIIKMQKESKGTTQKFVSLGYLRNFVMTIPPLSEQKSIVATLDSLKSKVDRLQENYDKISQECDALKQAILRQVFE